ncbi:MAG: DsrE family protein [Deltaproteobacteria bacterium]|nr:DsrE family protein [Deltaproteobacteria bacterium]
MPSRKFFGLVILLAVALALPGLAQVATAGDYGALQGVKSMDAVFDIRGKSPKSVLIGLKLVHSMYKDQALRKADPDPKFAVIFIGPAVKLVSTNRKGFSMDDAKVLDQLAQTLKAMAADGIELEICVFAAHLLKVDPATILPVIKKVPNGWISVIAYQQKGFALVPIY